MRGTDLPLMEDIADCPSSVFASGGLGSLATCAPWRIAGSRPPSSEWGLTVGDGSVGHRGRVLE